MKISLLSVLVLLSLSQDTRAREKKIDLIGPLRFINIQRPIVQKGGSNIRPSGNCMWRGLEGYPSKYSYAVCLL